MYKAFECKSYIITAEEVNNEGTLWFQMLIYNFITSKKSTKFCIWNSPLALHLFQATCFCGCVIHLSEDPALLCTGMMMQNLPKTRQKECDGFIFTNCTSQSTVAIKHMQCAGEEDNFWKLGKVLQQELKYLNSKSKKEMSFYMGFSPSVWS